MATNTEEVYFENVELFQYIYNKILNIFQGDKTVSQDKAEEVFKFMYEDMGKDENLDKFFKSKSTREDEALQEDEPVEVVSERDIKEVLDTYLDTKEGWDTWEDFVLDPFVTLVNTQIEKIADTYMNDSYAIKNKVLVLQDDLRDVMELNKKSLSKMKELKINEDDLAEYLLSTKKTQNVYFKFYDFPSNATQDIELYNLKLTETKLRLPPKLLKIIYNFSDKEKKYLDSRTDASFSPDGMFVLDLEKKGFIYYIIWNDDFQSKLEKYLSKTE